MLAHGTMADFDLCSDKVPKRYPRRRYIERGIVRNEDVRVVAVPESPSLLPPTVTSRGSATFAPYFKVPKAYGTCANLSSQSRGVDERFAGGSR